jgi:tRNA A-37 threonylcarbamoyl transferase component Bud32/tetratricopeptide (TPR) repeat protein
MSEPVHPSPQVMDAHIAGTLEAAAERELETHLARCGDCQRAISERLGDTAPPLEDTAIRSRRDDDTGLENTVRSDRPPAPPGTLPIGSIIGRYVIVSLLGQGAMGTVYGAFDPRLDRKVALKLLRDDRAHLDSAGMRERLIREAQALARLRHPNVLAIHDAGDHEGSVFIAMEYVEGQTLTSWLSERARSVGEVLKVFREAGRGLSAAHRAGLVHRDFKPDNVLVGADGAVRVADFGLARSAELRQAGAPGSTTPLQMTVGLVGTPAYMGPEQLEGKPATAQSDQFSFCVALWEALCGERPFSGSNVGELRAATVLGQLRPVPTGRRLPRRIRAALTRGLSPDPAERFADMDALLGQLGRPERRGLRMALTASALVIALIAGGVLTMRWSQARRESACSAGRVERALWSAELARPIAEHFLASPAPYAKEIWRSTQSGLGSWAHGWAARYEPICLAVAKERGTDDPELHARLACLDRQAANFRALRQDFARANDKMIRFALESIDLLPSGDDCRAIGEYVEPTDPATREKFRGLRERLDRAELLFQEGELDRATQAADPIVTAAHQAGFGTLEAEALSLEGQVDAIRSRSAQAKARLEASLRIAEASRQDSIVVVDRVALLDLAVVDETDVATAEAQLRDLRAAIDRVGSPVGYEADYQSQRAHVALLKGDDATAIEAMDKTLDILERSHDQDNAAYASHLYNSALAYRRLGRIDEARKRCEKALEIDRHLFGSMHPTVAQTLNLEAGLLEQQRDRNGAAAALAESLHIYEANGLQESDDYANGLNNLGLLEQRRGHAAEGAKLIERAIALNERVHGAPGDRAQYLGGLAETLQLAGRLPEALDTSSKALALEEKLYGVDSPRLGMALATRAGILTSMHRGRAAVVDLERSLTLMTDTNSSPVEREVARYELARALYESGTKARARQIAREVRAFFAGQGEVFADNVAEVDTWLREHP